MPEDPSPRFDFYIRIAESCETCRRHAADFAKESLPPELQHTASLMAYHLRQAEVKARKLAGRK